MPELPEVETTRRGLLPHLQNKIIKKILIREYSLRWPIPEILTTALPNHKIIDINRRGKYLLLKLSKPKKTDQNILAIHLGMSGSLKITDAKTLVQKHDHVDIVLDDKKIIRYTDPRRFGAFLWFDQDELEQHIRFKHLGPEPLTDDFTGKYLLDLAKNKSVNVKTFIMTNQVVVGVGNIYATEALFYAGINPTKSVDLISLKQWNKLVLEIQKVLTKAIKSGGTTLRDFTHSDGKPGYFKQELAAYGRNGQACIKCHHVLLLIKQQGRATVYCNRCQQ